MVYTVALQLQTVKVFTCQDSSAETLLWAALPRPMFAVSNPACIEVCVQQQTTVRTSAEVRIQIRQNLSLNISNLYSKPACY